MFRVALGNDPDAAVTAFRAAQTATADDLPLGPVTITVDRTATVDDLARVLAGLAAFQISEVALATAAAKPSTAKP
jgi:biopolymer transport protein ExbD